MEISPRHINITHSYRSCVSAAEQPATCSHGAGAPGLGLAPSHPPLLLLQGLALSPPHRTTDTLGEHPPASSSPPDACDAFPRSTSKMWCVFFVLKKHGNGSGEHSRMARLMVRLLPPFPPWASGAEQGAQPLSLWCSV